MLPAVDDTTTMPEMNVPKVPLMPPSAAVPAAPRMATGEEAAACGVHWKVPDTGPHDIAALAGTDHPTLRSCVVFAPLHVAQISKNQTSFAATAHSRVVSLARVSLVFAEESAARRAMMYPPTGVEPATVDDPRPRTVPVPTPCTPVVRAAWVEGTPPFVVSATEPSAAPVFDVMVIAPMSWPLYLPPNVTMAAPGPPVTTMSAASTAGVAKSEMVMRATRMAAAVVLA